MRKSKEKVLKRVCTLALSAALVAGSVAQLPNGLKSKVESVSAGDGYDGIFKVDGREYHYVNNKNDNNISLVCVIGTGEIKVPSQVKINGKTKNITGLYHPFGHNQTASKFIIPEGITTIGDYVFMDSTIDYIKLPASLKSIGANFCEKTKLGNLVCSSKKVTLGANPFNGSTIKAKKLIINDWLIRYTPDNKILDLNNYELKNIKHAVPGAISYSDKVTVLQIGKNETLLDPKYFSGESKNYIKEVYVNGEKVKCKNANDTVPDILKRHYLLFEYGAFEMIYANDKAKYVLNSMGLTYYGPNKDYFKKTLSAARQYEIALKVHNYILENYVYDRENATGLYTRVFNCHTVSKCQYDAEMYAFLLENAGVEAEVVRSQQYIGISESEKEELLKNDPSKYAGFGNYKLGHWGDHAWNVVKIGGKLYYVDTTNDRANNFYWFFLFTNSSINDCMRNNEFPLHWYPHYKFYNHNVIDGDKLYSFQTKLNNNERVNTPACNTYFGDVDNNRGLYISDNDVKVLADYLDGKKGLKYDKSQLDVNFDGKIDKMDLNELKKLAGPGPLSK